MYKYVQKLSCNDRVLGAASTMGYYDGNTVTALWNYAQHFAMSDNSFSTGYGPSTPGALNLISGNTFGATCGNGETFNSSACPSSLPIVAKPGVVAPQGSGTVYGDPQPYFDSCKTRDNAAIGGQ